MDWPANASARDTHIFDQGKQGDRPNNRANASDDVLFRWNRASCGPYTIECVEGRCSDIRINDTSKQRQHLYEGVNIKRAYPTPGRKVTITATQKVERQHVQHSNRTRRSS